MITKAESKTKVPLIFHGYAFLFCITIIAINPFALFRGAIWTQPKLLGVTCVLILHLLVLWKQRRQLKLSSRWRQQASAWIIFLSFGLFSTLLSPFPSRSFFGHGITADGWLYWFLLSGFVLTNSLVLQRYPDLFYWQLRGILVGATLVALSIYPQLLNWKLDYTIHSGHLWPKTEHVLATAVYRNHQPIGLYSHRGYASFTLAMSSVLSLVAMKNQSLPTRIGLPFTILCTVTLSLTKVRGALLAMLAGWLWLTITAPQRQSIRRWLIALSLLGMLSFGWATIARRVVNAEIYASTPLEIALKHFTSDRVYLWRKAWNSFLLRPWIGWGLNGYSIAEAMQLCPKETSPVRLENYYILCQNKSLQTLIVEVEAIKAHNLLLDWILSIGIPGTISYVFLLFSSISGNKKIQKFELGMLICYQFYGITWFDCAQISHLGWWSISIVGCMSQTKQLTDVENTQ